MKVLIIDDEASLNNLATEYFKLAGHDAASCADGESALALLARDASFDVIVLDKRLPGLSGVDTFKAIKSDPRLKNIPVIVLSASVSPGTIAEDLADADLLLAKPFHPRDLAAAAARRAAGRRS